MSTRAAPWMVATLVALAAGYAAGRLSAPAREDAASAPPAATEPEPAPALAPPVVPAPAADELAGLRACVRKLGEAEAHIERDCAPPAAAAPGTAPSAVPAPLGTAGQGAPAAALSAGASAPASAEPSAVVRAFSQGFMAHVVGTTEAESRWLQEYVCLVDDRRRRTESELSAIFADPKRASDPAAVDAVVAESKQERDAMLGDIETRLGKDRYKRMRDLGGLGILSRSCEARPRR